MYVRTYLYVEYKTIYASRKYMAQDAETQLVLLTFSVDVPHVR